MSDSGVQIAAQVICDGGIVVHATEGVWGFACDPFNEDAVLRVLALKQRSVDKGLIVIGAGAEDFARQLMQIASARRAVVTASWPGRHTWVLPNVDYPKWVTGGRRAHDETARPGDHPEIHHWTALRPYDASYTHIGNAGTEKNIGNQVRAHPQKEGPLLAPRSSTVPSTTVAHLAQPCDMGNSW